MVVACGAWSRSAFTLRSLWKVALVGCTAAAHWIAFFASIKVSNVSVALATLATTPVFVSVVEPLVHKRRVDVREVVLGVVIIGELLVLLWGPAPDGAVSDLSQYYLGVALALVSAALVAVFATLNSVLVRSHDSANLTRVELLSAAVVLAVLFLAQGKGLKPNIGVFRAKIGCGWGCWQRLPRRLLS